MIGSKMTTALAMGGAGIGYVAWSLKTPSAAMKIADPEYEKLAAAEKCDILYKKCLTGGTGRWGTPMELVKFLVLQSHGPTFAYLSDEMYPGQKKRIHSVGLVAKGTFVSTGDHPFTGVFDSKENPIIIRSSNGAAAVDNKTIPGVAVKFLRDGVPSVNAFALKSFEGVPGGNYFCVDLSNHLPLPRTPRDKVVQAKFQMFSAHATMLGLNDLARHNQDGSAVPTGSVRFPYEIVFSPNPEIANIPVCKNADWTTPLDDLLAEVKPGMVMFELKARAEPGDELKTIGHIKTTEKFVPSEYGDNTLFFKHIKMSDDVALRPEWEEAIKKEGAW